MSAHAADNASVTQVQFAFDGACTAASPTTFGTSARYTGRTDDAGGEDFVQIYHLDGNNTVVSRHTGSGTTHSAAIGITSSVNAFTRIVATPATGPYTAVLWDSTHGTTAYDFDGGDTMDLNAPQVIATYTFDMNALDPDCPGVADATPPTVATILRNTPASENTDADVLTWRVTFSETVQNVDPTDFAVGGTTGTVSNVNAQSGAVYDVTVSGGDLADLVNTVVSLGFAGGQNIQDSAGNTLANTTPGTNQTYAVDNTPDTTPPSVTLTSSVNTPTNAPFTVTATFSEDVTGFDGSDLQITNGTSSNLQMVSASVYTATITPTADGDVVINVPAGAAQDAASNGSLAATPVTVSYDTTAPTVVITANTGQTVGGAFTVTVTFAEDVSGFTQGEIAVSNGAVSNFQQTSGSTYTATITPTADGPVTVDVAAAVASDAAGNANTAAAQFSVTKVSDATPPDVTLTTSAGAFATAPFDVTATFSEPVTGFDVSDFLLVNGTASNFNTVSGTVFTVTITPDVDAQVRVSVPPGAAQDAAGNPSTVSNLIETQFDGTAPSVELLRTQTDDPLSGPVEIQAQFSEVVFGFEITDFVATNGTLSDFHADGSGSVYSALLTPASDGEVTVNVAAGAASDAAGNPNTVAAQLDFTSDSTMPTPTIGLPGPTAAGAFTATFTFDEDVTGFDSTDIVVSNGDVSSFTATNAREYSAMITPGTVGTVTVSLAQGAGQDGAGNATTAASDSLEVVFPSAPSTLDLNASVIDPSSVSRLVSLTNPGSQAIDYAASADVNWLAATPATGTISGSGTLNLTIALTAAADQLTAGTYNGTVTVSRSSSSAIVTTIPVTLTVAPRFGSIQIVATTPGGTQGNTSFTYTSSDTDLDGLSLATTGGTASSASFRKRFGTYDITQNLPAGWELDSLSCAGDTDGGSVIDLASGRADIDLDANETIVCTFANSRDDEAVRIATQRAINNYLVRRGDRILNAQPDIASRLRARDQMRPGSFSADATRGEVRLTMNGSLSGAINHAKANRPQFDNEEGEERQRWDAWISADYSSISDNRAGDRAESEFGIVQLGVDFAMDDRTIVGLMLQHDWMDETQEAIAVAAGGIAPARIDGAGWMFGPYAARQLENGLIVDVLALFGQSENDINPLGFYTDSFETDRYLIRANVSGEWAQGPWRVRPSASLSHFEETQSAYTDSLGIAIPEQSVSIGRLTFGPEVAYRTESPDGGYWEVHGKVNANLDYNPAGLMDATGRVFDTGAFRADAALGVRSRIGDAAVASFEVNMSGLGSNDFEANGARFELRIPFGG